MNYTIKDWINNIVNVHINNLNNIQKIISRLSNVGVTIFSLAITIFSIIIPLIYSLNITVLIRFILSTDILMIVFSFFVAHILNLKNERLWRNIYSDKCKINILTLKSTNVIYEILNVDFNKYKKNKTIKLTALIKSWWSFCWFIMLAFILSTMILVFFIY